MVVDNFFWIRLLLWQINNPLKPKLIYVIFKNVVLNIEKNTTLHHYKDQLADAV
jgi:hypothetical protein